MNLSNRKAHFGAFSLLLACGLLALVCSCGNKKGSQTDANNVQTATETAQIKEKASAFCGDSAFHFVEQQCLFGPRTLGSSAHEKCGEWLMKEFQRLGCTIEKQTATFTRYDGKNFDGFNIIASTMPDCPNRILICSHWDSRPWADADPDERNHKTPIDGANDGASGVGVMLELARQLQQSPIQIGIDFICFDAEDMGTPQWEEKDEDDEKTWCLGAQYWAANRTKQGHCFGILLDMVGGNNPQFYQEGFSKRYAPETVTKVWYAAHTMGYSDYFPLTDGGMITDDHLPLNRVANLPCIDIIPYYPLAENAFGSTWHTLQDNIQNINRATLEAVGQTLLFTLYSECEHAQ